MKKSILFLAGAALLFAGCTKVEDEAPIPENGKRVVTLKATVNESDTRVSVESDGTYNWQAGDKIGVWVVDSYGGAPYPYTTQDSGTTANFEVSLDAGEDIGEYAFYPFSDNHLVSGDGPRFALDANLQYVEDATNMPMLGTVSGGTISFKSVGGVIKLTVNNIPSDAAHLLFSAKDLNGDDLFISGVFPVSGDQITAGGIMGVNSINIDFTDKWKSSMEFYVPLPTGTYGGFEIEFDNANSSETLAAKKVNFGTTGLTVSRNEIILAPALDLSSTPTPLVSDDVYAIALLGEPHLGNIMMTALDGENHQGYTALGTTYVDGKLSIPAASAWRMFYDASSSSYYILSMSEDKYLEGYAGASNLKLASKEADKSPFFITSQGSDSQGNQLYQISVRSSTEERRIGFNYNNDNARFALYLTNSSYPSTLCLIPAVVSDQTPSLTFANTEVTVPASALSTAFIYTSEHLTANPTVAVAEDAYSIVSSANVDAANNQVVVNLVPNEDQSAKTATLIVSCPGVSDITLTVNQNGKNDIVQDVLTKDLIGVSGASYADWSGKEYTNGSGAVYAGHSSGGGQDHNYIQLKSADSVSGIVSTISGGKVKTITITWDSGTANGRTLSIYGKNTAYSSARDLYDSSTRGTLLGTIVMGTSTELTVSGDYEYVGLRSSSGAMYLTEIKIDWKPGSESGGGSDTKTYQHVFNAKPNIGSNITLSGVAWDISATNLGSYNSGNYAGVQIGSSSSNGNITLTSSSNWSYEGKTKITEVRLWLNLGGTSVTPTVVIGGKNATSDGTVVVKNSTAGTDWTKASKVTFTPAADGNTGLIAINIETVKAGYICAIEIDCE